MISSRRLPPPFPAGERYGPVQASLGPVELHLVLEAGGHHQGAGLGEVRTGGEVRVPAAGTDRWACVGPSLALPP